MMTTRLINHQYIIMALPVMCFDMLFIKKNELKAIVPIVLIV
jgi:hypothetical protein